MTASAPEKTQQREETGRCKLPWGDVTTGSSHGRVMSSQELLVAAGLDWDVATRSLYRRLNNGHYLPHPNAKEVYRSDTEACLGVVRGKYHAWPNREAFRFADTYVENDQGVWQEAGTQHNGARVFMTMKFLQELVVGGAFYDIYLFIGVGHDGYVAVNPSIIPIHRLTLSSHVIGDNSLRIQHTPSLEGRTAEVSQVLQLSKSYQSEFFGKIEKLQETEVPAHQVQSIFELSLNPKRTRRASIAQQIMRLYSGHTAYDMFLALTQWQCHVRKHREGNARFEGLMWGDDAHTRNRFAQYMLTVFGKMSENQ